MTTATQQKNNKLQPYKEVIFIKLLILFIILIIPISFMLLDISKSWFGTSIVYIGGPAEQNQTPGLEKDNGVKTLEINDSEFDFEAGISGNGNDLSNVPQEKIDSLFENLE